VDETSKLNGKPGPELPEYWALGVGAVGALASKVTVPELQTDDPCSPPVVFRTKDPLTDFGRTRAVIVTALPKRSRRRPFAVPPAIATEPFVKLRLVLEVVLQIAGPFRVKAPREMSEIVVALTFMEIRNVAPPCF
jgi:hypothetical protein